MRSFSPSYSSISTQALRETPQHVRISDDTHHYRSLLKRSESSIEHLLLCYETTEVAILMLNSWSSVTHLAYIPSTYGESRIDVRRAWFVSLMIGPVVCTLE